jgi:putative membrane protein
VTPSDQRLHPVSLLFAFGRSLKTLGLPGLVVLLTTGRSSGGAGGPWSRFPGDWDVWIMFLFVPSAVAALARYLSFRLRYEGNELIIRSGIIFRNERHVPYARIQNLHAVQNVVHRLFGVIEVRVETGASREPEATISALHTAAFEEMRRRVFEGRMSTHVSAEAADRSVAPAARTVDTRTLLHLPLSELLLFGFLENRGLVLLGALYGVLWELGLLDLAWDRMFDESSSRRAGFRALAASMARGEGLAAWQIVVALAGFAGFLIVVRIVSMCWAVIRLHGFRLTRGDEEIHSEFGLFTRVAGAIPLRRIQTIAIHEGPLHRLMQRVSLKAETAGGRTTGGDAGSREREWLAPLVRIARLPDLVREVMPEAEPAAVVWQPVHPRAFRRAMKPYLFWTVAGAALAAGPFGWWAIGLLAAGIPWALFAARRHVDHLQWAATDDVVMFRSGWIWRTTTIARVAKIQAVTLYESPFDRRSVMARLRIDTAGAGSDRVDIPFLARATARDLHGRLASQAAETAFRW